MVSFNSLLRLLLILTALLLFTGCGSILKGLVGAHNVNSVQLAANCQMSEALVEVKKGENHQSESNRAACYLLQALYLHDMNQHEAVKALYPEITKNAVWIKNEADIARELKKMKKDLGKLRKYNGFDKKCG